MIFSKYIHPQQSIYYYGAMILKELSKLQTCTLQDLYVLMQQKYQIGLKPMCFTMDWLYLIDAVIVDQEGVVQWNKLNL